MFVDFWFLGDYIETDLTVLERQKQILELFYRINQDEHLHLEYVAIGKSFSLQENVDCYTVSVYICSCTFLWNCIFIVL